MKDIHKLSNYGFKSHISITLNKGKVFFSFLCMTTWKLLFFHVIGQQYQLPTGVQAAINRGRRLGNVHERRHCADEPELRVLMLGDIWLRVHQAPKPAS